MECYKCGAALSRSEFCDSCGTDVRLYKKIVKSSEAYYNQGLARAQSRDLTGAADCLRQSVKLYKYNTKARNLLGLVYFEMGEAVAALSQWVISKSLQPEKNLADTYLNAIQKNAAKLDQINQTIRKYNQALTYAKQDSLDLAIIQLKKVLTMNPNLIKGHQLLALLYMKTGDEDKAMKSLKKAIAIDKSNPLTQKYMKELRNVPENTGKKQERGRAEDKSPLGNDDVIIPKNSYKESNAGGITVLNVLIGIAIGAALMWYLVFPAKEKALADESNKKQLEISDQVELKNSTIALLESEKEKLESEKENLRQQLEAYKEKDEEIAVYEEMMGAVDAYFTQDYNSAAKALAGMDESKIQTESFTKVFAHIQSDAGSRAASDLYEGGYNAYSKGDYETAKEYLNQAYELNPNDPAVIYYLGRSYQRSGDSETGRKYLQYVIDNFPASDTYHRNAVQYIDR